jgi:low affinity Fe/Cu permease
MAEVPLRAGPYLPAPYRAAMRGHGLGDRFDRIADRLTVALGSAWALIASVLLVVVWALTGPVFGFSDTWQLFINTTTTVVTFWMVFVIQNSQNRQSKATQLKLDELIRAVEGARNRFIELDTATAEELAQREQELIELAEKQPDGEVAEVTTSTVVGSAGMQEPTRPDAQRTVPGDAVAKDEDQRPRRR